MQYFFPAGNRKAWSLPCGSVTYGSDTPCAHTVDHGTSTHGPDTSQQQQQQQQLGDR